MALNGKLTLSFLSSFKHLLQIAKPPYLIYAETGGRGSGKTKQTAYALLWAGTHHKKRMLATRKEKVSIHLSSYKELIDFVDAGFDYYGWRYNSTMLWNIRTGATVEFLGVNDINESNKEALKGIANADIIWVDEAQTVTMATLKVLMPLLGRVENSCIIFTFNKIKEKLPVWVKLGLDNPAPHVHFNETNYINNPLLPKAFHLEADDEKRRFPADFERNYMNNPSVEDDNKVVKNWTKDNIQDVGYVSQLPLHITCDFNNSPNCWLLFHKDSDKIYYFDEYCKDMYTGDLIKLVLDTYGHNGLIVINGDASGYANKSCSKESDYILIYNELLRRGYKEESRQVQTGKRFRFDIPNANGSRRLRYNSFNDKVLDRHGQRCIIVSPKCEYAIYNMEELRTKPNSDDYVTYTENKIKVEPMLKYLGHTFDAMSYPVKYYWGIEEDYIKPPPRDISLVDRFKAER